MACLAPRNCRQWFALLTVLTVVGFLGELGVLILDMGHDPDLQPVPVQPSVLLRRLYQTGPTVRHRSLLTLFTTFNEKGSGVGLHMVVLNNWANLIALGVQPVLFTTFTNGSVLMEAQGLGWDILPINRTNRYGLPFIRDFYTTAYNLYNSTFYAYANADILFDETLVDTLRFFQSQSLKGRVDLDKVYVVGMRTDIPVDVLNPPPFSDIKFVRMLVKKERAKDIYSMDYFLTSRHGYPWHEVPDVVVGRIGYDIHLLTTAMRSRMAVVDATRTLHAVHLKAIYHNAMIKAKDIKDNLYNHLVLGGWDLETGHINNTDYFTQYQNDSIVLMKRRFPKRQAGNHGRSS